MPRNEKEWMYEKEIKKMLLFFILLFLQLAPARAESELTLVTLASGSNYDSMGVLAHKNHARFASLHPGLHYLAVNDSKYMDPTMPGAWWKVNVLLDLLPQMGSGGWMLWMDADTLFCDSSLDLLQYLREAPEGADMIVAQDIPPSLFNTGVFWIRNSEWSLNFLRKVMAKGKADVRVRTNGYYEQLAMQMLYKKSPEVRRKIYVIPNRRRHEFNAFVVDGSFRRGGMGILHDAGCRFRINPQDCQRWFRSYYCMCLPEEGDPVCRLT